MTAELAARLYRDVISPLVLGGALRPGHAIGGAAAIDLAAYAGAVDADLRSRTDLGRMQVARTLTALDHVAEASPADWILFAVLHDWLAAANPEMDSLLSRNAANRLVELASSTIEHVTFPENAAAALTRHTFLSRLFAVERKDTRVSFWVGSRTFLGAEPPERLLLWPKLRRVRADSERRPLASLVEHGAHVDRGAWLALFTRILRASPLTDVATATRTSPAFDWSPATLGLVRSHAGRTLATRALRLENHDVDAIRVFGRATQSLIERAHWSGTSIAAEFLAEIVLRLALSASPGEWSRLASEAERTRELFVGLAVGGLTAAQQADSILTRDDASFARARLAPLVQSNEAKKLLLPSHVDGT